MPRHSSSQGAAPCPLAPRLARWKRAFSAWGAGALELEPAAGAALHDSSAGPEGCLGDAAAARTACPFPRARHRRQGGLQCCAPAAAERNAAGLWVEQIVGVLWAGPGRALCMGAARCRLFLPHAGVGGVFNSGNVSQCCFPASHGVQDTLQVRKLRSVGSCLCRTCVRLALLLSSTVSRLSVLVRSCVLHA